MIVCIDWHQDQLAMLRQMHEQLLEALKEILIELTALLTSELAHRANGQDYGAVPMMLEDQHQLAHG